MSKLGIVVIILGVLCVGSMFLFVFAKKGLRLTAGIFLGALYLGFMACLCRWGEVIYEGGNLRNGNMVDYKIPTFMDSDVEMKITLVENGHPEGPYGVKGIGEPGLVATAAAIAGAVCHACNTDFDSLPIKPEHILFRKEVRD